MHKQQEVKEWLFATYLVALLCTASTLGISGMYMSYMISIFSKPEEWSVILEPVVRIFMLLISKDLINVYPYPSIIPPVMVCYKLRIEIQMLGTNLAVTKTETNVLRNQLAFVSKQELYGNDRKYFYNNFPTLSRRFLLIENFYNLPSYLLSNYHTIRNTHVKGNNYRNV
jgi:hypothetical protein